MIKVKAVSYSILFISFLLIATSLQAQTERRFINEAEDNLKAGDKKNALKYYLKAYEKNDNNVETNFNIGKLYLETLYKGRSLKYLEKAYQLKPKISKDINKLLGNSYQYNYEWDKAIEQYNIYLKTLQVSDPQYKKIERKIYECNNGKEFTANPINAKIENVGPLINSPNPDFAPVISADESVLIFTSRREGSTGGEMDATGEYNEDIYISEKVNGKWAAAKNIGTNINTDGHDASIGLSATGTELFTYDGTGLGDIKYCNLKKDSTWSKPHLMSGNVNTREGETSLCISPDGQTIFFTSDRPGGHGGLDIYMSHMEKDGDWGKAHNLGPPINTEENEDGPFMDFDGKTLYFSSRAHKGMGESDIFESEYDSSTHTWSEPQNMGFPINTADDDIYFVLSGNGKHGYYASVKDSGYGEKDIYMITMPDRKDYKELLKKMELLLKKELPKDTAQAAVVAEENKPAIQQDTLAEQEKKLAAEKEKLAEEEKKRAEEQEKAAASSVALKPVIIKGTVYDHTGGPLQAKLQLASKTGKVIKELTTGADGSYKFESASKQERKLILTAQKDEYGFNTQNIVVPGEKEEEQVVEQNFYLKKLEVGNKFVLRNIYFDFDKATLKPESYIELSKLLKLLQENPKMKVEIGGHTDSKGVNEYNKALSQKRAQSVVNWLKTKGVASARLQAHGYGEEVPLATNEDEEEGRELNRRTEFEVIANK